MNKNIQSICIYVSIEDKQGLTGEEWKNKLSPIFSVMSRELRLNVSLKINN